MSYKTNDFTFRIGVGGGGLKLGNTRKQIEHFLQDNGEKGSVFHDAYFIRYKKLGIQINYNPIGDKARAIFLYHKTDWCQYYDYDGFQGATLEGIDWNSTPTDVLKAYGKPFKDFRGHSKLNERYSRRMLYDGMSFFFWDTDMVRMSLGWETEEQKAEYDEIPEICPHGKPPL